MAEEKQEQPENVFLRTVLKKDVMDKLTSFCQQFKTGRGNWDYGVGIQVLLDFYEYHNKIATVQEIAAKMDYLLELMPKEKPEEAKTELLNGEKV